VITNEPADSTSGVHDPSKSEWNTSESSTVQVVNIAMRSLHEVDKVKTKWLQLVRLSTHVCHL